MICFRLIKGSIPELIYGIQRYPVICTGGRSRLFQKETNIKPALRIFLAKRAVNNNEEHEREGRGSHTHLNILVQLPTFIVDPAKARHRRNVDCHRYHSVPAGSTEKGEAGR